MARIRPLGLVTAVSSRVQATLRETPEATKVYLTDSKFALSWLALWFFHLVCAGLYGVWATVHIGMTRASQVQPLYFIGLLRDPDAFSKAGPIFALFAATHTFAAMTMVLFSVHYDKLAFGRRVNHEAFVLCGSRSRNRVIQAMRRCLVLVVKFTIIPPARFLRWLQRKYVDELFILQEVLEIVLLSIRAYRLTLSQSHSWLIHAYVVLLVTNCWSTPLIHWVLRQAKMEQRLLCHGFDMLSDFTSTLVLPAAMAWPLLPAFDPHFEYSRDSLEMQELSQIQLFAFQGVTQSWFDVFNTTLFSLFLLGRVSGIKSSLHRQDIVSNAVLVSPANPSAKIKHDTPNARKSILLTEKAMHLIHMLTLGWGLVVASVHISKEARPASPWCVGQTSPWFSTKNECPVIKIDCTTLAINGTADEFSRLFDRVSLTSVSKLQISGCHSLEMPPVITRLTQLSQLRIKDSTIERWDEDAAILQASQPELMMISISNTPLTPFPMGLCCSGKLPVGLTELVFEGANLSSLPDELEAAWTIPWKSLHLDGNAFTQIPDIIVRLRCSSLWMANNKITSVPNNVFHDVSFIGTFTLALNPITTLPKSLAATPRGPTHDLNLTNTLIEWLPSWIVFVPRLTMTGSRFCNRYGLLSSHQRAHALEADGMPDIVSYWSAGMLSCE